MTTKVVPGMLIAAQDKDGVAKEAATRLTRLIRDGIDKRGKVAVALSGGSTPNPAYALLAQEKRIDWSKVEVFWVDERAVPPTHERSNYRAAKAHLLDAAKLPADNVHRMPADAADLEEAAREYAQLLAHKVAAGATGAPQLDVVVLGIGDDGHTASLFPGERTVDVTDRWVAAVAAAKDREARLTITVPVIEQARALVIICTGKSKQEPLERIWSTAGDVHHTPGRIVRGCRGQITWVIDKAAGGLG